MLDIYFLILLYRINLLVVLILLNFEKLLILFNLNELMFKVLVILVILLGIIICKF